MKVVKREHTLSPVEFYRCQLEQIINFPVKKLTHTDVTLMAYVKVHGANYLTCLMDDRIFTNPLSIKNTVSKLTRAKVLIKDNGLQLNPKIVLQEEDFVQMTVFKKDENLKEVYHKYYQK